MVRGFVKHGANVCVLDADVKALLHRQVVELIVDVVRIRHVLLQANDRKALESTRLMHHRVEAVGVLESARNWVARITAWRRLGLLVVVLISARCLLLKVRSFENLGLVQNLCLNRVWVELDVEAPLLYLFGRGNHSVELLDGVDTVLRFLEQTLAHLRNSLLVLANFLRNANQHGEFWRQVDILSLLLDFKQGLRHLPNLHIVLLLEVRSHRNRRASLALFEIASFRAHVKAYVTDLVGLVVSVHGHDNGSFEFVYDGLLVFLRLWSVLCVALPFRSEALHLIVN